MCRAKTLAGGFYSHVISAIFSLKIKVLTMCYMEAWTESMTYRNRKILSFDLDLKSEFF